MTSARTRQRPCGRASGESTALSEKFPSRKECQGAVKRPSDSDLGAVATPLIVDARMKLVLQHALFLLAETGVTEQDLHLFNFPGECEWRLVIFAYR